MKVLIAGETWMTYGVHVKGFSAYYTGGYASGIAPLLSALEGSGVDVTHLPNHVATIDFPREVAALAEYDAVVLSDIGADTLLLHPDVFERGQRIADPLRAIVDYVAAGGGLLMIGGYMSFSGFDGHARYHHTPLADILPVRMLGADDRIEEPSGIHPTVMMDHPVLSGIPSDWPYFLGYNRLVAKESSQILMAVGDDPFLVLGTHGAGRCAAFASDCSPHWGSPEFTGWAAYATFWKQLLEWTGGSR